MGKKAKTNNEPDNTTQPKEKKKKKGFWLFRKKRPFEENFDENGNYIPRKHDRNELYSDYYGPLVEDDKGHKAGKFFLENYKELGKPNLLGGLIIILVFIVYFAYGIYNLYYVGGVVRTAYQNSGYDLSAYSNFTRYGVYGVLIIFGIWLVSLILSYLFVRLFAELVAILMYVVNAVEITLLGLIYYAIHTNYNWQYDWIILLIIVPNIFMLTIWYKKFKKAIYVFRMSSLVVAKQRELLWPQITQTLWIVVLSIFHMIVTAGTFFDITPETELTFSMNGSQVNVTQSMLFAIYTGVFIFCVLVVMYVSQGMKMLMIHNWYRGGKKMGFWKAFHVLTYRWWAIMGYAIASTLVRMASFWKKLLKKDYGPKNIKEVFTQTGEFIPNQVNALRKKKNTKWYERLWLALNKYTLPAVVIENNKYVPALIRSLYLYIRDIPQQYIKASHVNVLFFFIKYCLMVLNAALGFVLGYFFAHILGVAVVYKYFSGLAALVIFLWIGGFTSTLIVNDLNNSYVTIMYIHTVDDLNNKEGYTVENLKKLKGAVHLISEKPKWYQFKKKKAYKAKMKEIKAHPESAHAIDIKAKEVIKPRWYQIRGRRKWKKAQKQQLKNDVKITKSEPTSTEKSSDQPL